MCPTVYFADKAVAFVREIPADEQCVVVRASDAGVSRDKILKILETSNCVTVVAAEPERAFATFTAEFAAVEAAGGIVVDDSGAWLMIHRNGRWDLPKGHVEPGETAAVAAVREVTEETGVRSVIVRELCDTLHAYYLPKTARWELKCTHWYELCPAGGDLPTPQTEEGIDRVAWCSPDEVTEHLQGAFLTIRRVAEAMHSGSR